jgi:hypothetical protein
MQNALRPSGILAPKPFDVIFTVEKGELYSLLNILMQPFGDPKAFISNRRFSHVSIVLEEKLALEAVPMEDAPEIGKFSGSELEAGVRMIPVLDLVVPAWKSGNPFSVFRSRSAHSVNQPEFAFQGKAILELFASEYSLSGFRDTIESKLKQIHAPGLEALKQRFDWSSPPRNLAALLVEPDVKDSLERAIPQYRFPFKNTRYFCSKLVAELLQRTGLFRFDTDLDKVSPTGLFVRLEEGDDWEDVTTSDYGDSALEASSLSSPSVCRLSYTLAMEQLLIGRHLLGIQSVVDLMDKGTQKVTHDLEQFIELTDKLDWADVKRHAARSHETVVVESVVQGMNISDGAKRMQFRRTVRDWTRMFGYGLIDYDVYIAGLSEEASKL